MWSGKDRVRLHRFTLEQRCIAFHGAHKAGKYEDEENTLIKIILKILSSFKFIARRNKAPLALWMKEKLSQVEEEEKCKECEEECEKECEEEEIYVKRNGGIKNIS